MRRASQQIDVLLGRKRVHPFAARMAASIPFSELMQHRQPLTVLDPMAGSGTTLAVAKKLGHRALGFDSDPLAVLIARVGCDELNPVSIIHRAEQALARANALYQRTIADHAYPVKADDETRAYIRYWFDAINRRQLSALMRAIDEVPNPAAQRVFRCAVSRMIIVKSVGASRAMDVAHSRPHRVYRNGPIRPLAHFLASVRRVISAVPFTRNEGLPSATIRRGDARRLPVQSESVDLIITSPPYLNAIDYLRGHRLSLVWFGHLVAELRNMRGIAVGCERSLKGLIPDDLSRAFNSLGASARARGMISRYAVDLTAILKECGRVLKQGGRGILVVADSTIEGRRIKNARGLELIARDAGFRVLGRKSRRIPFDQRYLPPPSRISPGPMGGRMRSETILELSK